MKPQAQSGMEPQSEARSGSGRGGGDAGASEPGAREAFSAFLQKRKPDFTKLDNAAPA